MITRIRHDSGKGWLRWRDRGLLYQLEVVAVAFGRPASLGRSRDCDVVLRVYDEEQATASTVQYAEDPERSLRISRRHLELELDGVGFNWRSLGKATRLRQSDIEPDVEGDQLRSQDDWFSSFAFVLGWLAGSAQRLVVGLRDGQARMSGQATSPLGLCLGGGPGVLELELTPCFDATGHCSGVLLKRIDNAVRIGHLVLWSETGTRWIDHLPGLPLDSSLRVTDGQLELVLPADLEQSGLQWADAGPNP